MMKFTKMHGAGNDYVYVDCFSERVENPAELAVKVSHRHFGIGSDGLILIKPSQTADAEMEMYNADGSRSEMCGNGLRCVAKYMHDHHMPGRERLHILTGNGILSAEIRRGPDGMAQRVKLDMGRPVFRAADIPITMEGERILNQTLDAAGQSFIFSSVSMGNPHCVIFVEDTEAFPLERVGPAIEHHPLFPARVNVEIVRKISSRELVQRTWERGSGETWACGTGAAAVAVVARLTQGAEEQMLIHLKGGDLELEYSEGGSVKLTGPAVEVFTGEWPLYPASSH